MAFLAQESQPIGLVSQTSSSSVQDHSWYLDRGASHHLISNLGVFLSFVPYKGYESIMLGNGCTIPITHCGE